MNVMIDLVKLSPDEIVEHAWSLYRPSGECRSALIHLRRDGKIDGYSHPNEASWTPQGEGFAFLSRDGRVTSHSESISRNESGLLEIRMNHPFDPDLLAHVLVEARDSPVDRKNRSDISASTHAESANAQRGNVALSLLIPNPALAFLSPVISRAVFIANNPDIDSSMFETWNLSERDIVIQYNKPVFFDALARYASHKLHFHYPNIKSCWGFTDEGKPDHEYCEQTFCSLTFAVLNGVPAPVEQYFKECNGKARRMAILPQAHTTLYSYPLGKLPSCGFASVCFMRYLNWIRQMQGIQLLELVMVGFTGQYGPGRAWSGHDFDFEQRVYNTWLDLRRIAADGSAVPDRAKGSE
jgi:hypothetical protein